MRQLDRKATGKNLKRLFHERGLTIAAVSEWFGYDTMSTVSNWTRGVCAPRVESLVALTDLLGVTIDDIIITVKV